MPRIDGISTALGEPVVVRVFAGGAGDRKSSS